MICFIFWTKKNTTRLCCSRSDKAQWVIFATSAYCYSHLEFHQSSFPYDLEAEGKWILLTVFSVNKMKKLSPTCSLIALYLELYGSKCVISVAFPRLRTHGTFERFLGLLENSVGSLLTTLLGRWAAMICETYSIGVGIKGSQFASVKKSLLNLLLCHHWQIPQRFFRWSSSYFFQML